MIDLFGLVGKISIHAPRTGSDIGYAFAPFFRGIIFQSTLPARGATRRRAFSYAIALFQSTLPARGATPYNRRLLRRRRFQSTLPARGATALGVVGGVIAGFQSTLPARGATRPGFRGAEGVRHFNPRSPHGERPGLQVPQHRRCNISIHAPRTGSDMFCGQPRGEVRISIHAPRTGSDPTRTARATKPSTFQSTLPARGATFFVRTFPPP